MAYLFSLLFLSHFIILGYPFLISVVAKKTFYSTTAKGWDTAETGAGLQLGNVCRRSCAGAGNIEIMIRSIRASKFDYLIQSSRDQMSTPSIVQRKDGI